MTSETKNKSLKLNAVLNTIRSCLSIIFPLVTAPYISRVLGTEGVGKVSYVSSVISYFSLFAMLGVSSYAVREGAKRRSKPAEFKEFVSEVFTINLCTTVISITALWVVILCVEKFQAYTVLFFILSFSIFFQTFSVDWLNTIFEDYLYITIRTIIVYMIHLVLIFVLIRSEDDYYIYAILQVLSLGLICFSNWFYCRKHVKIKIIISKKAAAHLKPLIVLFANALMISIYVNFDTTMLGWYKNDDAVGLYTVAVKIYSVVKSILIALYSVTIPRLAHLVGEKDRQGFRVLYSKLWSYVSILLLPMSTGIICLSKEIILFMGGERFIDATQSLQILGGALIFAIFGGLVTSCLNITIGREKENLIATVGSACLNFGMNLFFIPRFSQNGAAFTTMLSEAFVLSFCFIRIPQKDQFMDKIKVIVNLGEAMLGSMIIIGITVGIKSITESTALRICSIICCSVIAYSVLLLAFKNDIFIQECHQLKKRIIRR